MTYVLYRIPYHTVLYLLTITHVEFIQLLVTRHLFRIRSRKEKTHMFYVASVIPLSARLELLWKCTLLVHYKLNIFRTPRVNQIDIRALLFVGYSIYIPLDKMV